MQVKVFESSDMASGLKMIKKELGPDALILSTKTIRSGKLGLLSKPRLEITAAIDAPWPDKTFHLSPQTKAKPNPGPENKRTGILKDKNRKRQSAAKQQQEEPKVSDSTLQEEEALTYDSRLQLKQSSAADSLDQPGLIQPSPEQNNLQEEVDELKGMIRNLAQEMIRLNGSKATAAPTRPQTERQSSRVQISSDHSNELRSLYERLLDYGISPETAQMLSDNAGNTLAPERLSDLFNQQEFISRTIGDLLSVNTNIFPDHQRQHRLALVGPTGVGKTTTLAKIAAEYLSNHSSSIAFITIDTYRIAAVEQLKVYGEIMNLPVEVVLNPEQLEQMLLKHRDKELILIDTAGRSPQDTLCINELASFLSPKLDIQKHLVLSATTREKELFETMQRFSILEIDNAIITKIDECSSLGLLLDIQLREKLPFSYITNGQRVPEDLLKADKELLTQLIMTPGKGLSYE